jgi:hypothetical protein
MVKEVGKEDGRGDKKYKNINLLEYNERMAI